jgi:hypothetical protein
MASKKTRAPDLTTAILIEIRDELRTGLGGVREDVQHLTGRVDILTGRVDVLTESVETLEKETIRGFTAVRVELDGLNKRIDGVLTIAGDTAREDRARVLRLEQRIDRVEFDVRARG